MNRRILRVSLLCALLVVLMTATALADTVTYPVEGGNIYFYTDIGAVYRCDKSVTRADIPSEIRGVRVTSIREAFSECKNLKVVTIPSSVTNINGGWAFSGCGNLISIEVSDENANYCSVDGVLFTKDQTSLIRFPPGKTGDYVIPESVTVIESQAFAGCDALTSIKIPHSVSSIGWGAFLDCSGLDSIIIPPNVSSIDSMVFERCINLRSVELPSSASTISVSAFAYCTNLLSVEIPDGVINIGESAFAGCSSLTHILIPSSVSSIHIKAFSGCTGLTEIEVDSGNTTYSSVDGVLSSCDQTTLILCPEGKAGNFGIPEGVICIESQAFYNCHNLSSVTIPNSVTSIRSLAFGKCSGLTSVTISESVNFIGDMAFYECSSLTSITIPNSVTSIGWGAFEYCNSLTDVYYSGTKDQWDAISVGTGNDPLHRSTVHYNSQNPEPEPDDKSNITFRNGRQYSILEQDELYISASIPGASVSDRIDLTWSSSDESIVEIVGERTTNIPFLVMTKVRGVSYGTATISLSAADGRRASCEVTVSPRPNEIKLSGRDSIREGATETLNAAFTLNVIHTDDVIEWSSSNGNILVFDSNGKDHISTPIQSKNLSPLTDSVQIYGRHTGTVTVTCKLNSGAEARYYVTVYNDETVKIKSLEQSYVKACDQYMQSVANQLLEASEKDIEMTIQQQAQFLQNEDAKNEKRGNSRLVSFTEETYKKDPTKSRYIYQAVSEFLAAKSEESISFEGGTDPLSVSQNIVSTIYNSVDTRTYSSTFQDKNEGEVTVKIDGLSFNNAHERIITYNGITVAALVSRPNQVQDTVYTYVNQLVELEKTQMRTAVKEAYKELVTNIGSFQN